MFKEYLFFIKMTTLPEVIHNGLNILSGNLNSSFSGQLSDFLQQQGVNMQQLWKPAINLIENKEILLLEMSIAGVKEDSVNISFFNNNIIIDGERNPNFLIEEPETIQRCREILYGKFERKITLPISITQRESVKIKLNNGILSVIIDKKLESKNKFSLKINSNKNENENENENKNMEK